VRSILGRGLLAMVFASLLVGCASEPQEAPHGPNILIVMTDDQDPSTLEHMPNVQERLVAEGTTFENYVTTFPMCCPSRATIQRGQYAHNTGVISNLPPNGSFSRFAKSRLQENTVATWVDEAGYRTGYFGKYMND
jgi:N-acetylglucosamine-6-sulfatase